jgi:MoxR-like ATPase
LKIREQMNEQRRREAMSGKGLSVELEKYYEPFAHGIPNEMTKRIVGAKNLISMLVLTMLSGSGHASFGERGDEDPQEYHSHILIEGGVGGGKTTISKVFTSTIEGARRTLIAFTRDLKPISLKQTVEQLEDGTLKFQYGPLYAEVVHAEEVTRAGDAVHSALIEAMAEGIIGLVGGKVRTPRPYMVIATANPRDVRGVVSRLGTAFSDRFAFRADSPEYDDEQRIEIMLQQEKRAKEVIKKVVSTEDILTARDFIHEEIYVDMKVARLTARLTQLADIRFRDPRDFSKHGAEGERPGIWLVRAAKARAFLSHRAYVVPQDIVELAYPVLRHRIDLGFGVRSSEKRERIEEVIHETLQKSAGVG